MRLCVFDRARIWDLFRNHPHRAFAFTWAAAAEERSRLARDLHDAVNQTLFSASIIAEAMPRIWDEDPEPKPHETNALNERDNGTHGSVRQRNKYVEQLDIYLHTGEVVHTCGEGPCDCTTGACD